MGITRRSELRHPFFSHSGQSTTPDVTGIDWLERRTGLAKAR